MKLALAVVLALVAPAAADGRNAMGGPVFGYTWGGRHPASILVGVEGGIGYGPERFNLGFEYSRERPLVYGEFDPWIVVGLSIGFGYDFDAANVEPTIGVWEGAPLHDVLLCRDGMHLGETISIGLRYMGAYEVYVAPKIGFMDPICVD